MIPMYDYDRRGARKEAGEAPAPQNFHKLVEEAESLASQMGSALRRGRDDKQLPMGLIKPLIGRYESLVQSLKRLK